MGLAYDSDLEPEPAAREDGSAEAERNRNLLRHAASVLCGEPVFGTANPIRVKETPSPVPRRIGSADVAQVAAVTERLGQLTGDHGGIPTTAALTAHTQASEALLGATMHEPVRQRLLVALSDAHRSAGGAAAGAGLSELSRQHFTRSLDCAGAGGDMLRAVVSMDVLGCRELDVAPNEALKLFQLGAATAPSLLCRAVVEYHGALALGLLGVAGEALPALRRARDLYLTASDEPPPWKDFATALPHVEGLTHLALGRFDRAALAFAADGNGQRHTVSCTMDHFSYLATAQLRCGELRAGLLTATRAIGLARRLRSVSMRKTLAPLQEAAAARRDSACQDLARELATLRSAA